MIKEGDVVEVKYLLMFGGEKWTPAIVTKVYDSKLQVQFIKSKEIMELPLDEKGRMWR